MSLSSCCTTGFRWEGTPKGKETTLGDNKAYVTGSNKDAAVLIVHDVWGWTLNNARILADHYAEEADVTVYLPDFFGGEVVDLDALGPPKEGAKPFDLGAFIGRNSKDIRKPEIFAAATKLKKELGYKKVGAIGFCYGGWAVFQLAAKGKLSQWSLRTMYQVTALLTDLVSDKGNDLVDCISTAHPSLLEKPEIDAVNKPFQLIIPETDPQFTKELADHYFQVLPSLKLDSDYRYFPGLVHGFATRGDTSDPVQKEGLERAKDAAVSWFKQYLH
ncbi:Alpha/Beta hydrolase protein [Exophiala viscosa]|uniref:Alpha/Beta hydrolase protein n=1 Tax=Exophiala viscosa TaxID=2486360 RepID=UPI00218CEF08|nr:Alpha/Beta hydrolase protein [Exophiala viscosa]